MHRLSIQLNNAKAATIEKGVFMKLMHQELLTKQYVIYVDTSPMQVTKAPLPICYICKPHLFNITSIFLKKTQNAKIATKFD